MHIQQLDEFRILISMCDDELYERYTRLTSQTDADQQLVRHLLSAAEQSTGISLRNKRLRIEASRYDRGCLFLITLHHTARKGRFRLKERSDTYTFSFRQAEPLIACVLVLKQESVQPHSSILTRDAACYRLVIPRLFRYSRCYALLSEYCDQIARGRFFAAAVIESGTVLCRYDALGTLSSAFGKKNQ